MRGYHLLLPYVAIVLFLILVIGACVTILSG